jgi:uncharacterized protein YecA (UPF0149 family)
MTKHAINTRNKRKQILISQSEADCLKLASSHLEKSEGEIIREALNKYFEQMLSLSEMTLTDSEQAHIERLRQIHSKIEQGDLKTVTAVVSKVKN